MNTEKVIAAEAYIKQRAAHRTQLSIVSPRWLWACHFRWEYLPESQFPLDQDYTVAMFDSDVNCFPGRYRSLSKRSRRHCLTQSYSNYALSANQLQPVITPRQYVFLIVTLLP